jgi:alkanesulfonate monooxygenase SsuD/methylene tetrahydromethanopterin reductase-like flavin-dependent oxidoreductase (luciferase family)
MTKWNLRYNQITSSFGASAEDLYGAALEQVAWADKLGCDSVHVSEHHGMECEYLPGPIVMAGAAAAVTSRMRISIVLLAPLYNPLRLAEDLAIVDLISHGRVEITVAAGYVQHEFDMFEVDRDDRVPRVEETLATLTQAWTGEPFEFHGRTVRVTPKPARPGGPVILTAGSTRGAARRAARLPYTFSPSSAEVMEFYLEERRLLGNPVPVTRAPLSGGRLAPVCLYVAEDPEAAWARIAPHAMNENNSYAGWTRSSPLKGPFRAVKDPDELRKLGTYVVVTPQECVELARGLGPDGTLSFLPQVGGLDPAFGWEGLQLFVDKVLPQLT